MISFLQSTGGSISNAAHSAGGSVKAAINSVTEKVQAAFTSAPKAPEVPLPLDSTFEVIKRLENVTRELESFERLPIAEQSSTANIRKASGLVMEQSRLKGLLNYLPHPEERKDAKRYQALVREYKKMCKGGVNPNRTHMKNLFEQIQELESKLLNENSYTPTAQVAATAAESTTTAEATTTKNKRMNAITIEYFKRLNAGEDGRSESMLQLSREANDLYYDS
ncbi:MAG: hypothetical protein SP4CHLAM5_05880 [Chlamydiia bacterium]|nr:hypothetical protein [Chlamydiia bacterium]MCH9618458.1 hypothetical protein [Chlamydiia bacterium]MCH9623920.1 hypothetical protein [Chlamydiia bacterium]